MTKLRILLAATAGLAVLALAGTSALAGSTTRFAFKASFAGTATTKVTGDHVDIAANAKGTGTLIGKSTLLGKGSGTRAGESNCVPFSGPATLRGATKTTKNLVLKFVVQPTSTGCAGEDQNQVTVSGAAKFMGGSGILKKGKKKFVLKKAKGAFTFSGYFDRGTGAFTVKFSGSLIL